MFSFFKKPHFVSDALHHLHVRKRVHHKTLEPFPHPHQLKQTVDRLVYIFGIIAPVMTIPQVLIIWTEKHVEGISISTWFTYFLSANVWLVYGYIHKERPIIMMYSLYLVLEALIIIGYFMYS